MGAGISFFRRHRKKRHLIHESTNPRTSDPLHVVSVASCESPLGSPIAHVVDNVFEVRDVSHDQFNDEISNAGLNLITENLSPHKFQLMNILQVTPRADEEMQCGVPDTPIGFDATIYKYYCPLCMHYYKRILKTKCCNNYICLTCCMDYLTSKGIEKKTDIESTLNSEQMKLEKINCPNCSSLGFYPYTVALDDIVRDYSRDNAEQRLLSLKTIPSYYQASPVRRGESFEDLKRKMIPYSSVVGIADVVTPTSIDNASSNNDDANRIIVVSDVDRDDPSTATVIVRRLDFEDVDNVNEGRETNNSNNNNNNNESSSLRDRSEVSRLFVTTMMNNVIESAIHK